MRNSEPAIQRDNANAFDAQCECASDERKQHAPWHLSLPKHPLLEPLVHTDF